MTERLSHAKIISRFDRRNSAEELSFALDSPVANASRFSSWIVMLSFLKSLMKNNKVLSYRVSTQDVNIQSKNKIKLWL